MDKYRQYQLQKEISRKKNFKTPKKFYKYKVSQQIKNGNNLVTRIQHRTSKLRGNITPDIL